MQEKIYRSYFPTVFSLRSLWSFTEVKVTFDWWYGFGYLPLKVVWDPSEVLQRYGFERRNGRLAQGGCRHPSPPPSPPPPPPAQLNRRWQVEPESFTPDSPSPSSSGGLWHPFYQKSHVLGTSQICINQFVMLRQDWSRMERCLCGSPDGRLLVGKPSFSNQLPVWFL